MGAPASSLLSLVQRTTAKFTPGERACLISEAKHGQAPLAQGWEKRDLVALTERKKKLAEKKKETLCFFSYLAHNLFRSHSIFLCKMPTITRESCLDSHGEITIRVNMPTLCSAANTTFVCKLVFKS